MVPPPPPLDDGPLFPPDPGGVGLTILKIVGGLAVLGAVVGGAVALSTTPAPGAAEPPGAPVPVAAAPETEPEPPPPLAPPPTPETVSAPDPMPSAPEPVAPVLAPKKERIKSTKPPAAEPKTLADELALMQSITASLKADDAPRTLRLVREHERDFPKGQFVEERRAAKARGLCRKGKKSAGRKEAARFEKRWPKSIHLAAVREDCGLD